MLAGQKLDKTTLLKTIDSADRVFSCPVCGSMVYSNGYKHRKFLDVIRPDNLDSEERPVIYTFDYKFRVYQCCNSDCKLVFKTPIDFAGPNRHVTFRLEDDVFQLHVDEASYLYISKLTGLTEKTIGEIIRRRYNDYRTNHNSIPEWLEEAKNEFYRKHNAR